MIAARYHDATKHHFDRFAPSLGYLDWASQPDPFRRYAGAAAHAMPRAARISATPYSSLYEGFVAPEPLSPETLGEFLRCSMGLSAWKEYGRSRWALRVNPSSGNLHPTEAWILQQGRLSHYLPREHALEQRCVLAAGDVESEPDCFLVALTSVVWREAWKYGERAFRYCQHDAGHAIGALRLAAAMLGWELQVLSDWSHDQMAALLGLDRADDFGEAEPEEPECVCRVRTAGTAREWRVDIDGLVSRAKRGVWYGRPNRLSPTRVEWPMIDAVCRATRREGDGGSAARVRPARAVPTAERRATHQDASARDVILHRRSALAFDSRGVLPQEMFVGMLDRLQPGSRPWDAIDWTPQVHLALFVHRVEGLAPGVYAYLREHGVRDEWQQAMRPDFLWEEVSIASDRLFLLLPIDVGQAANRLSCDQAIAADGFFSLGMLARFERSLTERGEWFYRRLFWECGLIGQVLYLEAEAAGARATGIGCYYDDPVHDLLGLSGRAWQSLYHFSMGLPVEDKRLTTQPGYDWES